MRKLIQQKLAESSFARWMVVGLVSFTMMSGYFLTDVMAPLKTLLESAPISWSSSDYGIFTSAYGWLNIFALMLIFSGIILDKYGIRFTGIAATLVMILGTSIKFWALNSDFSEPNISLSIWSYTLFELKRQAFYAAIGFAIFGVGVEAISITATKAIVKWFTNKETALALGINVATGRLGTLLAMILSPIIVGKEGRPSSVILICLIFLVIGLLSFIVFCLYDKKYDGENQLKTNNQEEFKINDIFDILKIRAFWYIAILCLLFYSTVFPFLKYAPDLMVQKFGISLDNAGIIPALLPLGTLILTPIFGSIYDKKGKGTTIMIIGSVMVLAVHLLFSVPTFNSWIFALILIIILGIAFSIVPSAMWPSVPKIISQDRLGTAYSLIFFIQNFGLSGIPLLIGVVLNKYCKTGTVMIDSHQAISYDYTIPMLIFAFLGFLSVIAAFLLKIEDKKKHYGLESPSKKYQ